MQRQEVVAHSVITDPTETWIEECLQQTSPHEVRPLVPSHTDCSQHLEESCYDEEEQAKPRRQGSKPHSTPLTLQWLEENYEIADGVCIPRSTLYMHYLDFCERDDMQPVNAASFGKIIRQQFPQLTTRRLGTRGQSKYHYYGIAIKENSPYFEVMYSKKGNAGTGDSSKKDLCRQTIAYSPRSKLGTLLPEFPNVKDLKMSANIPEEKVSTFIMMYRTHCQRILDTVIRANFDEVQSFLLHFWQGMPAHMVPLLATATIVNIIGVCDSILYKAISGVLMPTVLQPLPDSLTQVIRRFAKQLDDWLRVALDSLPDELRSIKFDLARRFSQTLRRQTSLNHLCQASKTVTHSNEITSQMLDDWRNIDLNSICKQTLYTMDNSRQEDYELITKLYREFEQLLQGQSPLEAYTDWLESMVDRCVVHPAKARPGTLRKAARQFLLMWSCFGTRVIRDMTLHIAPSFGSFHLIHLMFDDFVLYLVESLHAQERTNDLLRSMRGETSNATDESIYPLTSYGHLTGNNRNHILYGFQRSSPASIEPINSGVIVDAGLDEGHGYYGYYANGYTSCSSSHNVSPRVGQAATPVQSPRANEYTHLTEMHNSTHTSPTMYDGNDDQVSRCNMPAYGSTYTRGSQYPVTIHADTSGPYNTYTASQLPSSGQRMEHSVLAQYGHLTSSSLSSWSNAGALHPSARYSPHQMHAAPHTLYANPTTADGDDHYTPAVINMQRRSNDYDSTQHFPGYAYIANDTPSPAVYPAHHGYNYYGVNNNLEKNGQRKRQASTSAGVVEQHEEHDTVIRSAHKQSRLCSEVQQMYHPQQQPQSVNECISVQST